VPEIREIDLKKLVESIFNITLADYNISVVKGNPASNFARTVEFTVQSEYQ
jgi:hypothetical protein